MEYEIKKGKLKYRWTDIVDGFDMPIQVEIDGKPEWLFPTAEWQTKQIDSNKIIIDRDFYVNSNKI